MTTNCLEPTLPLVQSELPSVNVLGRSITAMELMLIQRMFATGRGYKDLIRDFQHTFNVSCSKQLAKQFLNHRSWQEVLLWLTGEVIDTKDLDKIPEIEYKHYSLLEKMIELNRKDEMERQDDISGLTKNQYYIPESVKYFNIPLYGQIITYKYKDPYLKCFLLDETRHITKIEDIPVSNQLPPFLLSIIKTINNSKILTNKTISELDTAPHPIYDYITDLSNGEVNIFDSEFFKKYGIVSK